MFGTATSVSRSLGDNATGERRRVHVWRRNWCSCRQPLGRIDIKQCTGHPATERGLRQHMEISRGRSAAASGPRNFLSAGQEHIGKEQMQ